MLRSLKNLEDYTVTATDGDVGSAMDFLLDDELWAVRDLIVDTGNRLARRRVLVKPSSFTHADWAHHRFHVALSLATVKAGPSLDIGEPVPRLLETEYERHSRDTNARRDEGNGEMTAPCRALAAAYAHAHQAILSGPPPAVDDDTHLRSAQALRGYHIQGLDGPMGHVSDFIVDDETWQIRFLVVETSNRWLGKKVLIAPTWAKKVDWKKHEVFIDLSRHAIENSPSWDATAPVNREYEARLYDYYGRPLLRRRSTWSS